MVKSSFSGAVSPLRAAALVGLLMAAPLLSGCVGLVLLGAAGTAGGAGGIAASDMSQDGGAKTETAAPGTTSATAGSGTMAGDAATGDATAGAPTTIGSLRPDEVQSTPLPPQ